MEYLVTKRGHKVYNRDDFHCVCVDFSYFGEMKTLQVPYAAYRPITKTELLQIRYPMGRKSDDQVIMDLAEMSLPDDELQNKLAELLVLGKATGRNNTNATVIIGSPAAQFCRAICFEGAEAGHFDLGNVYEMSLIWLEADTIDKVDPTVKDYQWRALGKSNPDGMFSSNLLLTSTLTIRHDGFIVITPDGKVMSTSKTSDFLVIPSRVL